MARGAMTLILVNCLVTVITAGSILWSAFSFLVLVSWWRLTRFEFADKAYHVLVEVQCEQNVAEKRDQD